MRRLILGALFASVSLSLHAQIPGFPNGCKSCGIRSYVDLPAKEDTVSVSDFVIHGWGFECASGQPADRVDLFYQDYDGKWHPLRQPSGNLTYGGFDRPDVWHAMRDDCPNVNPLNGWQLVVTNPPPLGLRRIAINVWRGPHRQQHQRTYLIVK